MAKQPLTKTVCQVSAEFMVVSQEKRRSDYGGKHKRRSSAPPTVSNEEISAKMDEILTQQKEIKENLRPVNIYNYNTINLITPPIGNENEDTQDTETTVISRRKVVEENPDKGILIPSKAECDNLIRK